MSIVATFYRFSKRKNSTAVPSGGTSYNVSIKDPCSVLNPTIRLTLNDKPTGFNYMRIPDWNRYYYITDWVSDHGFWIASATVDVLASWRSQINESSQYVVRSYSENDPLVIDSLYPITDQITNMEINLNATPFLNAYRILIAVTNNEGNKVGGSCYYYLTPAEVQFLMNDYLLDSNWFDSEPLFGLSDGIMKALINPIEYIGECYILPYEYPNMPETLYQFKCGWWAIDQDHGYHALPSAALANKFEIWRRSGVVLNNHPQVLQGRYMNGSPFSELELYAGAFGHLVLDPIKYMQATSLDLIVYGDFKGKVQLDIQDHDTGILYDRFYADVAVPFSLTQLSSDASGLLGAGIASGQMIQQAASVNLGGALVSEANAIQSASQFFMPRVAGQAQSNSIAYLKDNWKISQSFHHTVMQDRNLKGAPLCQTKTLSDLSGYCMVSDADIDFPCYEEEHDQLKAYFEGGFFLE